MKNFTYKHLFGVLFGMLLTSQAFSQTNLLMGYRNGGDYQDSLAVIDTTGGMFTIIEHLALSSDAGDSTINGLYGMAVEPFTGTMYCVYGFDGGASDTRRLGTLDVTTGNISDIDSMGNISDITFIDSVLYGTTGTAGDYTFVRLNKTTAEITELYQHLTPNWSNAINFDFFKDRILKSTQSGSAWDAIDAGLLNETSLSTGTHPGWTTCLEVLNDSTTLTGGSSNLNIMNTNTFVYSSVLSTPATVHSLAFAELQPALWVNGPRTICAPASSELVFVGGGTTFEWYKDSVLVDGESDDSYEVFESGVYYVVVDGKASNKVTLSIIEVISNFAISSNPSYLEGAANVDVSFFEIVSGTGLDYSWNSGNGETSTNENPTFSYDGIGTYDVELTVLDPLSGCTGISTQTLEIIGGLGVNELEIDFNIYPVPAVDIINVNYSGNETYNVEVMDIAGAIISTHKIQPNGANTIAVGDLPAGTYILKITDGKLITKQQFVKQ